MPIEDPEFPEDFDDRGTPVILNPNLWGIAKKVKVEPQETEGETELLYWATVVQTYRKMGGEIEFRKESDQD